MQVNGDIAVGGVLTVAFASDFLPQFGQTFDLFNWGGFADFAGVRFDFSAALLPDGLAWDTSAFASSGIISIGVTPIPNPSVAVMLGLGLIGACRRRR